MGATEVGRGGPGVVVSMSGEGAGASGGDVGETAAGSLVGAPGAASSPLPHETRRVRVRAAAAKAQKREAVELDITL
jgi:hypothetical protein